MVRFSHQHFSTVQSVHPVHAFQYDPSDMHKMNKQRRGEERGFVGYFPALLGIWDPTPTAVSIYSVPMYLVLTSMGAEQILETLHKEQA